MNSPQPRRSRDDVLDVAEDLFTREGAQGLSVRRIASALGVSRQIVYSRFAGKPDLVRALQHEGFRRLTQEFEQVPGPSGTTDHMLAMARAYRTSAMASPALYELMFGRPVVEFEPDSNDRAIAAASFEPVIAACRAWLNETGHSSSRTTALSLARRIWAATHGVVSLESAGLLDDEAPRMIDDLVTAMMAEYDRRPGNR